jgi:hypothetical protein
MCKNKLCQSSGTKNELFKIQGRKTNFINENNSLTYNVLVLKLIKISYLFRGINNK